MKTVPVKVKKVKQDAIIPVYQTKGAAGFDLHAYLTPGKSLRLEPGEHAAVGTGLAFQIPEGYELQVRPRSGLAMKYGITVTNSPGTVDADFRGEVKVLVINLGKEGFAIEHGQRIAQAVLNEVPKAELIEVNELEETERGNNGFGHTGV
jgi:dUTP pyrophosphatase